jgi:hypothetical protein
MFDIVMIGSSIFEFWRQPKWGEMTIANHALRGTQSQDWLTRANEGQLKLPSARHILVYCGSNDLIYGHCPTDIVNNVCALLETLSQLYPNTHIGYFSIMLCPQKVVAGQQKIINDINQRIKKYCYEPVRSEKYRYFHFNDFIENEASWFVEDGLHLTQSAYLMLDKKLGAVMKSWLACPALVK